MIFKFANKKRRVMPLILSLLMGLAMFFPLAPEAVYAQDDTTPTIVVGEQGEHSVKLPAEKVPVADTANLTEDEKASVKDAILEANPEFKEGGEDPATITIAADGSATFVFQDEEQHTVEGAKLVVKKTKLADQTELKIPETKVKVADLSALTDSEKELVKSALVAANPNLPKIGEEQTVIAISNTGEATFTFPDKSTKSIPAAKLVEEKENSDEVSLVIDPEAGDEELEITVPARAEGQKYFNKANVKVKGSFPADAKAGNYVTLTLPSDLPSLNAGFAEKVAAEGNFEMTVTNGVLKIKLAKDAASLADDVAVAFDLDIDDEVAKYSTERTIEMTDNSGRKLKGKLVFEYAPFDFATQAIKFGVQTHPMKEDGETEDKSAVEQQIVFILKDMPAKIDTLKLYLSLKPFVGSGENPFAQADGAAYARFREIDADAIVGIASIDDANTVTGSGDEISQEQWAAVATESEDYIVIDLKDADKIFKNGLILDVPIAVKQGGLSHDNKLYAAVHLIETGKDAKMAQSQIALSFSAEPEAKFPLTLQFEEQEGVTYETDPESLVWYKTIKNKDGATVVYNYPAETDTKTLPEKAPEKEGEDFQGWQVKLGGTTLEKLYQPGDSIAPPFSDDTPDKGYLVAVFEEDKITREVKLELPETLSEEAKAYFEEAFLLESVELLPDEEKGYSMTEPLDMFEEIEKKVWGEEQDVSPLRYHGIESIDVIYKLVKPKEGEEGEVEEKKVTIEVTDEEPMPQLMLEQIEDAKSENPIIIRPNFPGEERFDLYCPFIPYYKGVGILDWGDAVNIDNPDYYGWAQHFELIFQDGEYYAIDPAVSVTPVAFLEDWDFLGWSMSPGEMGGIYSIENIRIEWKNSYIETVALDEADELYVPLFPVFKAKEGTDPGDDEPQVDPNQDKPTNPSIPTDPTKPSAKPTDRPTWPTEPDKPTEPEKPTTPEPSKTDPTEPFNPTVPTPPITEPTKPEKPTEPEMETGQPAISASIVFDETDFVAGEKVPYSLKITNEGDLPIVKFELSEAGKVESWQGKLLKGQTVTLRPGKLFRAPTESELRNSLLNLHVNVRAQGENRSMIDFKVSNALMKSGNIYVKLVEVSDEGMPTGYVIKEEEVHPNNYKIGERYKVQPPQLVGYDFHKLVDGSDPAEGVLSKDSVHIVFGYSSTSGLEANKGSVKVRYLEVSDRGGVIGEIEPESYVVKNREDKTPYVAKAKEIPGYIYIGRSDSSANDTGKVKKGETLVVVHLYQKADEDQRYREVTFHAEFDQGKDMPVPERVNVELINKGTGPNVSFQVLKKDGFKRTLKVPETATYDVRVKDDDLYDWKVREGYDGYYFTLSYKVKLVQIEMNWLNAHNVRLPESIVVNLIADNEDKTAKKFEIKAKNDWKLEVKADPRYKYTLNVPNINGFDTEIRGNDEDGFRIEAVYNAKAVAGIGSQTMVGKQSSTLPATGAADITVYHVMTLAILALGLALYKKRR